MKIFMVILMSLSFLFSVMPITEHHLCDHEKNAKQELTEKSCSHQEKTSCCSSENSEKHDHHEDHDCTPQCHCKCFSPHLFIPTPTIENIIVESNALLCAKPISYIQSDHSSGIFQPPRFV